MFEMKKLEHIEEIKAVQSVEEQVWKKAPIPFHQTYTASKNGGLVIGGYIDGELVAFQYSFPGFKNGNSYLYSHMLGILPKYQKSGFGKKMKEYQRELALEMGYSLIVWTFDPLESVNAYLNLNKLKGIGATYLENYYGMMEDALNKGLPTDRFLVEWWIQSEHVKEGRDTKNVDAYKQIAETKLNEHGLPVICNETEIDFTQDIILAPIPENFQLIKEQQPELALEWRYKTRNFFQTLCENGYVAEDVRRNPQQRTSYYVFKKRNLLALTD